MAKMTTNRISKLPRRSRGFTLIEVLIALIIMSVGMLGIAGLYVHSMQAGRTSLFRHNAVILAGDVADRIRANPRALAAYAGAGADNNCVDGGINCTVQEMAEHDIYLWSTQADETLPNGTISIDFTAAAGTVPPNYEITVAWSEPGQSLNYTIRIPVFPL